MIRLLAATMLFLVSGCAASYTTTRTTTSAILAKPPTCDFVIATTRVERAYEEVAILDRDQNTFSAQTAAAFKNAVQSEVCALGGDAVIAEVNGAGTYVRGTVIRWK